ncbi:hypothetical protein MKX01_031077, partial [Papaver californicum]
MKSLGLQQVESLGRVESLLKVLVESQLNTQLQLSRVVNSTSIITSTNYKNDEEKRKVFPNPPSSSTSINPLHQPALESTTILTLTQEEEPITVTAVPDNLAVNVERPSEVNDNQEITQVILIPDDQIEQSEDGLVLSKDVVDGYEELYEAAENGDWKVASKFLKKNPEAITKVIASDSRTVLHVAIIQGNLMFTEEIVNRMPLEILEYKTSNTGYKALHYAALCGYTKAAEVLVKKNLKLTQIEDKSGRIPLVLALISVTGRQRGTVDPFSGNQGDSLLRHTIDAGYYDIASSLVQRFPELVIDQTKKVQTSAMNSMAERPFACGAKLTFWERRIYSLVEVEKNSAYEFAIQNPPENSENTKGDKEKPYKWRHMIIGFIFLVPYLIYLVIKYLYVLLVGFFLVKVGKGSHGSHPQSLKGTNGDEENPVERFEGSCRDEKNLSENLKNTEGDKAKRSRLETYILGIIFMVPYLIYLMIKYFFVFLLRCIPWSP